ncbi:MAG: hypothetical protein V6Z89_12195 [Desulfobacter sp.]
MLRLLLFLRQHARTLKWTFWGIIAAVVVFDCFAPRHHPHFWGDYIRGFWSLFAFLGCVLMIVLFKGIYHVWLMKEHNTYE